MTPFAIAGVQMQIAAGLENVTAMNHKIESVMARFPWVQMILFSELATFGPIAEHHPESPTDTYAVFSEAAKRHGVWLIPGSIYVKEHGQTFNETVVLDPSGSIVNRYRKMFPFSPYEAGVAGGDEVSVFDVPGFGRFGLSICYDIWFPETTRQMAAMGAEVLLHPVLTGTIDRDIELSIARSTAAMFQCYVFDINGLGSGGVGRSCVVDPSGTVLYQAAGQEEIIPFEVDFDTVRRQRTNGLRGLGQTLKSFRDHRCDFPVYDEERFETDYLDSLGPLAMPPRSSPHDLAGPVPQDVLSLHDAEETDHQSELPPPDTNAVT